jgi:hypothetical protein
MVVDMRRFLDRLNHRPGVIDSAIAESEKQLGAKLPAEYVAFLKLTNGGEGFIGKEYVILWGVQELTSMNQSYEVNKFAPGFLIFGSSGGGETYGFDTRTTHWPIVRVPFVGMDWDYARQLGDSFSAFLSRLHETNESNRQQRPTAGDSSGKEIFEITPVILGGSPTATANKALLNREDHIQAVAYWNKLIAGLRAQRSRQ